ncbi:hypothetical protein [Streptomyces atroolivaceus]|uniref:hypothetical protein n=1 Tax=Streptomyces atroolivaceus TaxID=66869 RepID=UPI000A8E17A6|nr:hypothetical protein [Streptomyces atroolivaceus]
MTTQYGNRPTGQQPHGAPQGTARHERLAVAAIVVSAVGLVGGMVLGALLA